MEVWTIWLAFGAAALAFVESVRRWVIAPVWRLLRRVERKLERLDQVLDIELVNGKDESEEGYKGFREEVMERLADGSAWMRDHEARPADVAHGLRRPPR